jgi:fatty-acyl-CoA synthase
MNAQVRTAQFRAVPDGWFIPRGTREVAALFSAAVAGVPGRIAVSDLTESVTYEALGRRVAATAEMIDEVAPGDSALLASDEFISFAVGVFASAVTGRTCVVVPSGSSTEAIEGLARSMGPTVLLVPGPDAASSGEVPSIAIAGTEADRSDGHDVAARIAARDRRGAEWQRLVALDNTSGSTGRPKMIGQVSPLSNGRFLPPLDLLETPEHVATVATSSSMSRMRVGRSILAGERITGFPLGRFAPGELLARLAAAEPTLLLLTPTLLRHLHRASAGRVVLGTVDEVQIMGEQLRWTDVALAREVLGPAVTVRHQYGSTEIGLVAQRVVPPDEPLGAGPVSVGHPIVGRHVWIADDDGAPVGDGRSGSIVIEGAFRVEGIVTEGLPDGTERFVIGDRGRFDAAGELWIEGRMDRMVKIAGSRVEPGAVEDVLRTLPGVRDAVVLPLAVTPEDVRLIAHVVVTDDAPSADELRHLAAQQLSSMSVPARFMLHRDAFPVLASGKVDLRGLSEAHGSR